ncbi:ABC transporter permease [Paenibacillus sp. MSJ-34]|uniref:ABC transporter permease n=1 Tax=Paenibacillus sp. MSJ-34 TaxID=2841529 RepID=UPI001C0F54EF|nr:ABC transporter permease [Paenibacillus sp. MSJ-34]MBU5442312.1 ABC transporter permease [Paenibacillus sp. MSJ-34]
MKGVGSVFRNNMNRMKSRKNYLFSTLAMTIAAMAFAIYFTAAFDMKGSIAVVTEADEMPIGTKDFRVERLAEVPPKSQLVRGKYDAVIVDQGNGTHKIETVKGDAFKEKLQQALASPERPQSEEAKRGVGMNILGFLIMFVLLEGMLFMNLFAEDKANGTLRRVIVSPASLTSYMLAQSLFCFVILYAPTYVLLVAAQTLLGLDLGFTLLQYAWLLGLLAALATAFALFMTAWIDSLDNAMMAAASIIVLTSILSGSFYTFSHGGLMKVVVSLLPQKQFLNLVQDLEQRTATAAGSQQIGYLLVFTAILFVAGWAICRRRSKEGRY